MNWFLKVIPRDGSATFPPVLIQPGSASYDVSGIVLNLEVTEASGLLRVRASVEADTPREVILSLVSEPVEAAEIWSFDGPVEREEIYRQSPHDVDAWVVNGIARQSVPMVAVHDAGRFHVAVNGSPSLYANGCSQHFDPRTAAVALRSGDDGASPGLKPSPDDLADLETTGSSSQRFSPGRIIESYHRINVGQSHTFEALLLSVDGHLLEQLRTAVYRAVSLAFAPESIGGSFGSLSFATAWMNLRVNDSGKSRYWVVPAGEYSNIQYNRDAFWIAMMLEPEMDRECLLNELAEIDPQAEYPLFTMIWSGRVTEQTGALDRNQLQACLDAILRKVESNWYLAFDAEDGRHDFQYWQDSIAYAADDSIAYNQGLLAVALSVAEGHGLDLGGASADLAAQNYRSLFDAECGCLSVSRFKTSLMSPDSLVPDLLAQLYFRKPLLSCESVATHIDTLNRRALTPYGYKVLCRRNGDYPSDADLSIAGYTSLAQKGGIKSGDYQRGGSWFLYDCLCLLDAVLHAVPVAAQLLVWRVHLEMDAYGTTFEYLHTETGEPHKSNMGWNVAIYAMLRQLTEAGRIPREILHQIEATAL